MGEEKKKKIKVSTDGDLIKAESSKHKVMIRLAVLGETQASIADLMDITRTRVVEMFSLKRNTQARTYKRISEILGVPVMFLHEMDDWEGLLNPAPEWLERSQDAREKIEYKKKTRQLKQIAEE